jgi:hypothetical protein
VRELRLHLPALRRDQFRVAGILAVLLELGLGEEIIEADLPDAAAQLQTDVPVLGRPPAEVDAAFGAEELARRLIVVDAVKPGNLAPGGDLEIEVRGDRAARLRAA